MGRSKISWTDLVWNPTVGCTKISAGCKNCYAERIYERFHPGEKFSDVHCIPGRLDEPLHWKKPRRVFVDSMSDLFHEDVPSSFIDQVFEVMHLAYNHIYMILTKRPKHMYNYISQRYLPNQRAILPNVRLGVSAENQAMADRRIPLLLKTPAAIRFISVEPMLEYIDLAQAGDTMCVEWWEHGIDWVICGCESGPGARPMELDWARSLRDQCQAAGVPFFLKQAVINGKLVKMPELDGKVWDEMPIGESD